MVTNRNDDVLDIWGKTKKYQINAVSPASFDFSVALEDFQLPLFLWDSADLEGHVGMSFLVDSFVLMNESEWREM